MAKILVTGEAGFIVSPMVDPFLDDLSATRLSKHLKCHVK